CGSQARCHVRAVIPDDTERTLPSPRQTLTAPVDRAWTRKGSQLALVVSNCGVPLAPWNMGALGYSYGKLTQDTMVWPPGSGAYGQLARFSAKRTVLEDPSRIR